MTLMENMSVNTFDNADNMIPFKELQGTLVERDNRVCSSMRSWRAFIRLRKGGFLKAGFDWKDKEFTDKHNHYVNPDRFLEEVKKLKNYSDIKLKSDTSITPITPLITQENEGKEKVNLSSDVNNDNVESNNDNASGNTYLEKYVSELEQDKKRFIKEKEDMEARFAMVFSGYDRVQKELYASEKEVTKLRLQLGASTPHLSKNVMEEQENAPEQKPEPEAVEVVGASHHTTPSQSPQTGHHEDFVSDEVISPSSISKPHTEEDFGGEETPPPPDYYEGKNNIDTTYA